MSNIDHKKIAQNTIYLYLRLIFNLGVSFYTTRLLLELLGVEDYGIYSVVLGVVILFEFIDATMSKASSRFISYEIGLGEKGELQKVFTSALTLHVIISLIFLVVAESIGLWMINNVVVIPQSKIFSSNIVYQFAILTSMTRFISVPFNALIISNERMGVFAFVQMTRTILTLAITLALFLFKEDILIAYGVLTFLVGMIIMFIYIVYCRSNFEVCKLRLKLYRDVLSKMFSFSMYTLIKNISVATRSQGIMILVNVFFGSIVNAAAGVATQINTAVTSFGYNLTTSFEPQIIRLYAQGEYDKSIILINSAVKYVSLLMLLMVIPLIAEAEFIIGIWLSKVPEYTIIFSRLMLTTGVITCVSGILLIGIQATGKVKNISILNSVIYLSIVPIVYVLYRLDFPPSTSYYVNIIITSTTFFTYLYAIKVNMPGYKVFDLLKTVIFPNAVLILICYGINQIIINAIEQGVLRFIVSLVVFTVITTLFTFIIILTRKEKDFVINKVKKIRN